jgi:hypothetical protein
VRRPRRRHASPRPSRQSPPKPRIIPRKPWSITPRAWKNCSAPSPRYRDRDPVRILENLLCRLCRASDENRRTLFQSRQGGFQAGSGVQRNELGFIGVAWKFPAIYETSNRPEQPRFEVSLNHVGRTAVFLRRQRTGSRVVATGPEILVKTSVAETSKAPVAETTKEHPWSWISKICKNLGTAESRQRHRRRVLLPEASRCLPPKQPITRRVFGLESAIRIKSDYAKSAYAEFMPHLRK